MRAGKARTAGDFEKLLFLEPVTHPIERFDHVERIFSLLELFAQALDVAIDCTVIDVYLVVIGGIHQRVAAFNHTGPDGERLKDDEFRDRKRDRLVLASSTAANTTGTLGHSSDRERIRNSSADDP